MRNKLTLSLTLIGALILVSGCQEEKETKVNKDLKIEEGKNKEETEGSKETQQNVEGTSRSEVEEEPKQEQNQPVKEEPEQEKIVLENKAFKITSPAPDQKIKGSFVVEGKARVFEANFLYRLEDGHNVLAEGFVTASEGAPAWGYFKFEINYEGATSPSAVLVIYEGSAKDGSPQHELFIPLKVEDYK